MTKNRTVFLEEAFDSVFNGVEFEIDECSEENKFRTFVLPNGDRIVVCFARPYNMNRYDTPYWFNDKKDSKSLVQRNKTRSETSGETKSETRRRKRTRVFVHYMFSPMKEIEEYTEDHVWLINQTNMELWNHQTHQLVKTIDVVGNMVGNETFDEPFVYFMKNGNIAVFTTDFYVYDPNRPRSDARVLKILINQPHKFYIKLVAETTENELYFLFYCNGEFKHNLISMINDFNCIFRLPIETKPIDRFVSKENRDSGSLERRVSKCLTNKRDRLMLDEFRCFVQYTQLDMYCVYEWNSGRSFRSEVTTPSSHQILDFGRMRDALGDKDIFMICTRFRKFPFVTKQLWLMSTNDFDVQCLDKMHLSGDDFRKVRSDVDNFQIFVVDENTFVCILTNSFEMTFTTRVFKIRSRYNFNFFLFKNNQKITNKKTSDENLVQMCCNVVARNLKDKKELDEIKKHVPLELHQRCEFYYNKINS